jgi:nicotinamidase-related amidase
MPVDLTPYLHDAPRCAVLVFECQENVLGKSTRIPGLAKAVHEGGVLTHIARLLDAAREAGAPIFYCVAKPNLGDRGRARTPLVDRMEAAPTPASGNVADTSVMKEIAPEPGDLVYERGHGMSAFYGTTLDPCLRDAGTATLIPVGVSLNIGLVGTAIEAVNRGYRVIVPSDCTAADPPEYGEMVLRYTIRNLAYLTSADEIIAVWQR